MTNQEPDGEWDGARRSFTSRTPVNDSPDGPDRVVYRRGFVTRHQVTGWRFVMRRIASGIALHASYQGNARHCRTHSPAPPTPRAARAACSRRRRLFAGRRRPVRHASKAAAALDGGGLRMGQVVGESSSKAEVPKTTPITPQDLMATVFHVLGIPPTLHYNDPTGRPTPMINGGRPIAELI